MLEGVPGKEVARWRKPLGKKFARWQTLCHPLWETGRLVILRVGNLARDVMQIDVILAFHKMCKVHAISEILICRDEQIELDEERKVQLDQVIKLAGDFTEGDPRPDAFKCTVSITADLEISQPIFVCADCTTLVCIACAKTCHNGHGVELCPEEEKGSCNCTALDECTVSQGQKLEILTKQREEDKKHFEGFCYVEVDECYLEDALRLHEHRLSTALGRTKYGNHLWNLPLEAAYWRSIEVAQCDLDDESCSVMMFPIGDLKFKI